MDFIQATQLKEANLGILVEADIHRRHVYLDVCSASEELVKPWNYRL